MTFAKVETPVTTRDDESDIPPANETLGAKEQVPLFTTNPFDIVIPFWTVRRVVNILLIPEKSDEPRHCNDPVGKIRVKALNCETPTTFKPALDTGPEKTADVPEISLPNTDEFVTARELAVKAAASDPIPDMTRDATVHAPAFSDPTIFAFPDTARDAIAPDPELTIPAKF